MIHVRHIIEEPFIEALKNMVGGRPHSIVAMAAPENNQYRYHNFYAHGFGTIAHEYVLWTNYYNKKFVHSLRDPLLIRFEKSISLSYDHHDRIHLETKKEIIDTNVLHSQFPDNARAFQLNGLLEVKEVRIYCYENKGPVEQSEAIIECDILADNLIAFVFNDDSVYWFHGTGEDRLGTLFKYANNVSVLDNTCNHKEDFFGNKFFKLRVVLN
jgi:hypothetical protein